MALPTWQNPLDWATQFWNILVGYKVDQTKDAWLLGPLGQIGEKSDQYVARLAQENGLTIHVQEDEAGLMENFDDWPIELNPAVADFYRNTSAYELKTRIIWKPVFGSLGYFLAILFSRRIQQLNLPHGTGNRPVKMRSKIIQLRDKEHRIKYTIWHRSITASEEVVFYGIYSTCRNPSGEFCIKALFPLPRGYATVIFRILGDEKGNLKLVSSGERSGDPGFYFIVEDRNKCLWKNYLPSMRETIAVTNRNQVLTAEHTLCLWNFKVYRMSYDLIRKVQPNLSP